MTERQAMTTARWRVVVLAMIVLAWLPALAACFYWDDLYLLLGPGRPASPADAWTRDLWGDGSTPFYRPVLLLSLWLDGALWPGWAPGAHLQSLAWHLGAVALLYGLVARRAGERAGLVAAAAFGLHPIQVEAVTWVSARSDPLCAFWALAALALLDRGRLGPAALAALLAGCSKEGGLLLPLVWPIWRLAWGERPRAGELAALGAGAAAAWGLRRLAPLFDGPPDPASLALFAERWVIGPTTLAGWLVAPWPLTGTASLFAPWPGPWPAALVAVGLLGLLVRAAPRRGLLVLLAFVLLVPGVLATRASVQIGERLLYFPLVFLAAAAAPVLAAGRTWVLTVAAVLAIGLLETRLLDWRDTDRLEARALATADDPFTWHWVGVMRGHRGDLKGAFEAHLRAVRGHPPMVWSCADPVGILLEIGASTEAKALAAELAPTCAGRASFDDVAARAR